MTRRPAIVILSLWVLAVALAPVAAQQAGSLDDLILQPSAGGTLTVVLKTTGAVGPFQCGLPSGQSAELTLAFPSAAARLKPRYPLDGRLLREAVVEPVNGGAGTRVRFLLGTGVVAGIEQSVSGFEIHFAEAPAGRAPVQASDGNDAEYRVGTGDKLEIAVFGHEDLTKVVEVRSDGTINYPLIGDIEVRGLSVAQIDDRITKVLGQDYLVDPQVSVDVREYQSQWVTVIGEIRTPGRFVLKRNMRLIDVLAEAGGVTKEAGGEILVTRHEDGGQARQILLERDRLMSRDNQEANILLQHMDIITVGEKKIFYIRGEVTRPGSYFLESGLTLMKAISVAGGLTPYANRKDVQLLRAGNDGSASATSDRNNVNLKAIEDGKKPDVPLLPNDVIIVPRRIF